MRYSDEIKAQAKEAWLAGEPVSSIVERLGINSRRVIYRWREDESWDNQRAPEHWIIPTTRRYNALIDKEHKTDQDWQEIDKLTHIILSYEKITIKANGGNIGPGRPPGVKNGKGKGRRKKKNQVDHLTEEDFIEFEKGTNPETGKPNLYKHQKILLDFGEEHRKVFHLKGRQEGATYTYGYRAFRRAVLKKHNQIFISSTKAQAEIFKSHISIIAREFFGVELAGNPVIFSNGAELHFLSPNSFADSRSGDVYFDECFKTKKWKDMEAIAAPMATLKKYTKTYFSSPTAQSHEAYEIWSGERYTRYNPEVQINVDVPKEGDCELTKGRLDPDGFFRIAFTIHDCIRMGWDQVTLEDLKLDTPDPDLFAVTYECQFLDDSNSVFKLADILACGVDPEEAWPDFNPEERKPIGDLPCTAGYDPAAVGDNASFATMTFPRNADEKFRLLDKQVWRSVSAPAQCVLIEDLSKQYNYDYCEIDATGPGLYIPDFVREHISNTISVQYNPVRIGTMVQKAQSVIKARRFEYNENDSNLPLAFLTIYIKGTENGVVTYKSRHSKKVGHGDEAWACMHAFMCEPLNPAMAGGMRGSVHE